MWTAHSHNLDAQTSRTVLSGSSGPLSFCETVGLWRDNADFRGYFTALISGSPFDALFWETPPVTDQTSSRPFEFVLLQAPPLSRLQPDPSSFMPHFSSQPSEEILTFPNLGGDAILVVPAPLAEPSCYIHLARFLRDAPRSQVDTFWRSTGLAMEKRLSSRPTWLSTAGLGVSWLHLRLDSRPKYYRHEPYKTNG